LFSVSESKEIIDSLKKKIESVISLYEGSREQVGLLEMELNRLKEKVQTQEKRINELNSNKNQNNLAEAFLKSNGDPHEARLKINNIVREIDKCIALLNK